MVLCMESHLSFETASVATATTYILMVWMRRRYMREISIFSSDRAKIE